MHRLMAFAVVCDFIGVTVMASAVVAYTSQQLDTGDIKKDIQIMDSALKDARRKGFIGMVFITMAAVANVKIAMETGEE